MAEQVVVNVSKFETRVALLENGLVVEVFVERHHGRGIVGNIYLGKVQRVLPGMQAAFVEIGTERAAFLYVGDVLPHEEPDDVVLGGHEAEAASQGMSDLEDEKPELNLSMGDSDGSGEDEDTVGHADASGAGRRRKRRQAAHAPRRIEELIRTGQTVLVQVTKDAIGTKGPRVTCNISLPGRQLVYMPTHHHIGVSRRITDDEERQRLKTLLDELRPPQGGFVVRTASEGLSREKIATDVEFLHSLWMDITKRAAALSAPALVQPELDLVLRSARDLFSLDVDRFVIDDSETHERVVRFAELLDPRLLPRISRFDGAEPIFDHFGIETELARAMSRKVWLKSGGYLVIDQAEALTAIDVNTGRFVGKRNLADTILRTNLEAVEEVAYQLRLRNIGGMVIIDFIDMELQEHRDKVLAALTEALRKDRARSNVVKLSELGLVEMTRQRTRESLGRLLSETCWYCEGRGTLKSKRTVVYEIFRALERRAARFTEPVVVVHAHPEVVDVMYDEERIALEAIEERTGKRIVVRPRGSFHQEQFDIFGTAVEAALRRGSAKKVE
ncbi:MAG: Rne/Rng family ribonuclease [Myxococcota bacterium]